MINIRRKSAIATAVGFAFVFLLAGGRVNPGADAIIIAKVKKKNVIPDIVNQENREKIRLYFRNQKITYSNPLRFDNDDLAELGIKCKSAYDIFQIERIRLIGYSTRCYYYHVFCSGYAKCDNKYDRFRFIVCIERSSGKIVIQNKEKINLKGP